MSSGPTNRNQAEYGMRPRTSAPITTALVGMIMFVIKHAVSA